jgi:hypothetical protein
MRKGQEEKRKGKGISDFSPSYPPHIARRSCSAKRFLKTDSAPPKNPLHQHNHSRSRHSRSRAKRTLKILSKWISVLWLVNLVVITI